MTNFHKCSKYIGNQDLKKYKNAYLTSTFMQERQANMTPEVAILVQFYENNRPFCRQNIQKTHAFTTVIEELW